MEKVCCSEATQTDTKPETKPSTVNSCSCSQKETVEAKVNSVTEEAAPLEGEREEESEEAAYSAAGQGRRDRNCKRWKLRGPYP